MGNWGKAKWVMEGAREGGGKGGRGEGKGKREGQRKEGTGDGKILSNGSREFEERDFFFSLVRGYSHA